MNLFSKKKTKEVELLPWAHDITYQAHFDLIEYLRKSSKNQTVCLEISSWYKEYFDRVLYNYKHNKLSDLNKTAISRFAKELEKRNTNKKLIKSDDMILAALHVVMVCEEMNHTIIPIESNVSVSTINTKKYKDKTKRSNDDIFNLKKYSEKLKLLIKRDNDFLRNILTTLKNRDKIIVIAGTHHTLFLENQLKKHRFNYNLKVKHRFDILKDGKIIKKLAQISYNELYKSKFTSDIKKYKLENQLTKSKLFEKYPDEVKRKVGFIRQIITYYEYKKQKKPWIPIERKPITKKRKIIKRK